jgi:predicted deacetylase
VVHGWSHTRADGRDGAELAGRRPAQVQALIQDGLAELRAAGLSREGFIAPAYAHPAAAGEGCLTTPLASRAARSASAAACARETPEARWVSTTTIRGPAAS